MVLGVIFQACKPEIEGELGTPFDKAEGLSATPWVFTSAAVIDEFNPSRPRKDITSFYTAGEQLLTLNFNADGTFTAVSGSGKNPFPEAGTWSFDNNETPRELLLESGGVITQARLSAPTRVVDQVLEIEFVQRQCVDETGQEKPVLSYAFTFNRQN